MHRQVTISLDHAVDDGLSTLVGHGRISKFIEDPAHAPVLDGQLDAGYRAGRLTPQEKARRASGSLHSQATTPMQRCDVRWVALEPAVGGHVRRNTQQKPGPPLFRAMIPPIFILRG